MRYNTINPHQTPIEGDIQIIKKFAYLPVKIGNQNIWLEHYEEKYLWTTHEVDEFCGIWAMSAKTEWVLIGKKIIN